MARPKGVRPSVEAWRRVSRAVAAVENAPAATPLLRKDRASAAPTWAAFGTVTVAIPAGSWGSPGEGKATLEHNGQEVACFNRLVAEEITVGTNLVLLWIGGAWQAFATCP